MFRFAMGMFLLASLAACSKPAPAPTASGGSAGDVAAGKVKYDQICATCHGANGMGDGAGAAALNPKPRNFGDAAYMDKKSDADLRKVIKEGGPAVGLSPLMPPWGSALSDQDITNVIAYIRTFSKGGK